ncbi:hypothetical protein ACMFMG_004927 [Clarireedia jacksonii]
MPRFTTDPPPPLLCLPLPPTTAILVFSYAPAVVKLVPFRGLTWHFFFRPCLKSAEPWAAPPESTILGVSESLSCKEHNLATVDLTARWRILACPSICHVHIQYSACKAGLRHSFLNIGHDQKKSMHILAQGSSRNAVVDIFSDL